MRSYIARAAEHGFECVGNGPLTTAAAVNKNGTVYRPRYVTGMARGAGRECMGTSQIEPDHVSGGCAVRTWPVQNRCHIWPESRGLTTMFTSGHPRAVYRKRGESTTTTTSFPFLFIIVFSYFGPPAQPVLPYACNIIPHITRTVFFWRKGERGRSGENSREHRLRRVLRRNEHTSYSTTGRLSSSGSR